MDKVQYENRLVIFLDILGFRSIVNDTYKNGEENDELVNNIFNVIGKYSDFFSDEGFDDEIFQSKQITQFSDSIVVSFVLNDPGDIIFSLANCLHLLFNLVWKGYLCRGGIAYGKLIHTDKIIFGPALVEAYDIETKAALYPRVIVSENVLMQAIKEYQSKPQIEKVHLYYGVEQMMDCLTKDLDGLYFIDYIRKVQGEIDDDKLDEYYKRLRKIIQKGLKSPVEHLIVKYSWMKEKYNEFVENAKKSKKALKRDSYNGWLIDFVNNLRYVK